MNAIKYNGNSHLFGTVSEAHRRIALQLEIARRKQPEMAAVTHGTQGA